jgi:hypothetical protein
MNVAALELTADPERQPADGKHGLPSLGHAAEWIDPEGSDWFTDIYRELAFGCDPGARTASLPPDLEHWFG